MAKDILTLEQLEAQAARRREKLEYLKRTNAPPEAIRVAEKDLQLTCRRLERARAADYDEEMQTLQILGEV